LLDNSQIPTEHWQTGEVSDYEKQATVYFFKRLQDIYGSKFFQSFKTTDSLRSARREWSPEVGKLSREQIDTGIEKVKNLCSVKDGDFEWPNIALTIGICNGNYKTAKTEKQLRQKAIDADESRRVSRERWLADTGAQDRAKKARDSAMKDWRAKLAL